MKPSSIAMVDNQQQQHHHNINITNNNNNINLNNNNLNQNNIINSPNTNNINTNCSETDLYGNYKPSGGPNNYQSSASIQDIQDQQPNNSIIHNLPMSYPSFDNNSSTNNVDKKWNESLSSAPSSVSNSASNSSLDLSSPSNSVNSPPISNQSLTNTTPQNASPSQQKKRTRDEETMIGFMESFLIRSNNDDNNNNNNNSNIDNLNSYNQSLYSQSMGTVGSTASKSNKEYTIKIKKDLPIQPQPNQQTSKSVMQTGQQQQQQQQKLPSIHHLELDATDKNKLDDAGNSIVNNSSGINLNSSGGVGVQTGGPANSNQQNQQKKRKSKPSKYSINALNTSTLLMGPSSSGATGSSGNVMSPLQSSTNLNSGGNQQSYGNDFLLNYHSSNSTPQSSSSPSPVMPMQYGTGYQTNDPSSFFQSVGQSSGTVSYKSSSTNSTGTNQHYGNEVNEYMALSPTGGSVTSSQYLQSSGVNTPQTVNHSPPYIEYQRSNSFDSSNANNQMQNEKNYYTSQASIPQKLTNTLKYSDYDQMSSSGSHPSIYPGHYPYYETFTHPPAKKTHRRRPANIDKSTLYCHHCNTKTTPEWRRGPNGPATLCNACGLAYAKKQREDESNLQKLLLQHSNSYNYHRSNIHESYVTPSMASSLLPLYNTAASVPYMTSSSSSTPGLSNSYLTYQMQSKPLNSSGGMAPSQLFLPSAKQSPTSSILQDTSRKSNSFSPNSAVGTSSSSSTGSSSIST
ncbi:putative GATA-binding transcription factor [Heterostelium album PN500]|uniref:Putative GATA-binding transcription factor n=1 Tax=Heterostelium pallidum (strain ATCC 26659 / Pp 5 / PN500) TaxID=670386 RepID=D3BL19_HETP5|nr:putative GATA-binding transcription factor [Heterostelium album PN500]EFA77753.1 putative GATA-binding transcription factor [Heterostelium album PN500]|eukprot:XP_020429881.1 putative GATA-binding transcription factor [Heterostelium album PN500]